jgi:hypothetical protein
MRQRALDVRIGFVEAFQNRGNAIGSEWAALLLHRGGLAGWLGRGHIAKTMNT